MSLRTASQTALLLIFFVATLPVQAEKGVTADQILLGTTSNLGGTSNSLAKEYNAGFSVWLQLINDEGGSYGRKIKQLIRDDGYQPEKSVQETKELIEKDQVFSLVNYSCTPCLKAIMSMIHASNIFVYAPFSGAEFLRLPTEKLVFNLKDGYTHEFEHLVEYAYQTKGLKKFCVFYQDDALGASGTSATAHKLATKGAKIAIQKSYQRNTVDVDDAAASFKAENCDAVVLSAQALMAAKFIQVSDSKDFHPTFLSSNLVGTEEFLNQVKTSKAKIILSQVFPFSGDSQLPVVAKAKQHFKKFAPMAKLTSISFEGYLSGLIFGEALKRTGRELTREKFMKTLESMKDWKFDGLSFTFDPETRQASSQVYLTTVENGQLVRLHD